MKIINKENKQVFNVFSPSIIEHMLSNKKTYEELKEEVKELNQTSSLDSDNKIENTETNNKNKK